MNISFVLAHCRCVVSVIYTPSRWNSPPPEELARANKLAESLGLDQVGWIFTALGQVRGITADVIDCLETKIE